MLTGRSFEHWPRAVAIPIGLATLLKGFQKFFEHADLLGRITEKKKRGSQVYVNE